MDWQNIIQHYQENYLPSHKAEIECFTDQPTLADAIKKAALAQDHRGKRYAHQCRMPQVVLKTSLQKLSGAEQAILAAGSFDELHKIIESTVINVKGIGELYCYDTAFRIGSNLSLEPTTVFLHAGTRVGARLITSTRGRRCLAKEDLPVELRGLPAAQVEDILCLYKDKIGKAVAQIASADTHGCR